MKAVIRFSTNWQDEIDFHSMIIIDEERGVDLMKKLSALKEKALFLQKHFSLVLMSMILILLKKSFLV